MLFLSVQTICTFKPLTWLHIMFAKIFAEYIHFEHKYTFLKSQICTQTLTPPRNHVICFENQKSNAMIQTPIQKNTFHQHTSFSKYWYFLSYGPICPSTSKIFCPSKFELFDPKNPKIWAAYFPSCALSSIQIEANNPKVPELILILIMKQVYKYFLLQLPVGDLL